MANPVTYEKRLASIKQYSVDTKNDSIKINKIDADLEVLRLKIAKAKVDGDAALIISLESQHAELVAKRATISNQQKLREKHIKTMEEASKTDPKEIELQADEENGTNFAGKVEDSNPIEPGTTISADSKEVAAVKAANERGSDLSCNDADVGRFEAENADSNQGEIVVIGKEDHTLFAGIKFENAKIGEFDTDSYTAQRINYYYKDDKTQGFVIPWDGRFGNAYSNTQTIGNYMPYGAEWVGSPSLANPYALIRFDHVAGRNHHKHILDQRGGDGGKFSGIKYKPYANVSNYSDATVGNNGEININDSTRTELGALNNETIQADSQGALYIEETDYSQEIWKPTKDVVEIFNGKKVLYSTKDTPASIIVNTPERGKEKELARLNELKGLNIGRSDKNIKDENSDKLIPTEREFWLKKKGWIKCGNLYVEPKYCAGGQIQSISSAAEEASLITKSKEINQYINKQIARDWRIQDFQTNKKYLRKQNTYAIIQEKIEPTFEALTDKDNWKGKEQFQYRWIDFLYASHYGWIPNNHMITLRRFPTPVNDSGTVPDQDKTKMHILPVAQAVSWMGEATGNKIGDFMTFSYRMNWRDIEAKINEVQGNEQGSSNSPFGQGFAKWLGVLSGEADFSSVSGWDQQRAKFDPYADGMYANRVYGPVNVITKTKARARGLHFEHPMNVNFHYSLKALGGINPKAAMLDILANILALTGNNADFWGGANRYFPNKPAYPFLGGKKGMKTWYSGDMTGFMDGLGDQLVSSLSNLGSFIQNLLTNPKEALKSMGAKGGQMFMANKQRDKRPAILGFKALLTGDPVGEWHLCIGNPFNPIMMIGNLIVTSTKVTFSDQLGADDFPEDMIITITLEHGRSRDKGDIESMFNRGAGRLHYSYFGQNTEYWNSASSTKDSKVDTSWKGSKTTIDNNFTGKSSTVNSYNPDTGSSEYSPVTDPFPSSTFMGKSYAATTKLAYELSEKIGFKSGSS